jgi:beta-galactosidase beta subunit
MVTLLEIRNAIIDENQSLASTLRKAKVLSQNLENHDFKNWIDWELTGYPRKVDVPPYRILPTHVRAEYTNGYYHVRDMQLQINVPDHHWREGIAQLEIFLNSQASVGNQLIGRPFTPDMVQELHKQYTDIQFLSVNFATHISSVMSILATVKDRLLSFVLELERLYPDQPIPKTLTKTDALTLERTVQNYITVNHNGGNLSMATFDQRQQQVHGNQYNAARDINFGEIKTREDFVDALNTLHKQVEDVQPTNDDETETAVDIKANLEKAIIEANKENPDKGKIRKFLDKASDFAKTTAAFAGMVTIFHKAAEALQALPFI